MGTLLVYALIFGTVAAVAVCVIVVKKYKSGLTSPIYPLEHYTNLNLRFREDRFLNRTVTKVKVASSNTKR